MFILGRRKGGVSARTSQRGASRGHDWEIQMCREEGPTETCFCFDIVIRCAGATSKFHENLVSVLFLAPGTDGHISVTASQARDFHPREAATKKTVGFILVYNRPGIRSRRAKGDQRQGCHSSVGARPQQFMRHGRGCVSPGGFICAAYCRPKKRPLSYDKRLHIWKHLSA